MGNKRDHIGDDDISLGDGGIIEAAAREIKGYYEQNVFPTSGYIGTRHGIMSIAHMG